MITYCINYILSIIDNAQITRFMTCETRKEVERSEPLKRA